MVTDAQILEKYADATLFVIRYDHTPKSSLVMVESLYHQKKFKKMNLIFNAIRMDRKYGYKYGYYEYS